MKKLSQLKSMSKNRITVKRLSIIVAASQPLPLSELADKAGVTRGMIQIMLRESDGYLRTVNYTETRRHREGRPATIAAVRTAKAARLLKSLG